MTEPTLRECRYFPWPDHLLPVLPKEYSNDRPERARSNGEIADLLGCTSKHVGRLRRTGLDYWTADRLATRVLRRHPSDVWPNWNYRTRLANLMETA